MPGQEFDLVDVPDYRPHGVFLRPALAAEGVRVGRVALAMHGLLSSSFRSNWPGGEDQSRDDIFGEPGSLVSGDQGDPGQQ